MITRNQAKRLRKLKSRRHRDEELAFLVEGVRLVEELLACRWDVELVVNAPSLAETPRGRGLLEALEAGDWPRAEVSESEFKQLADTETPQGVLAVARRPLRYLADYQPPDDAVLLVFDRVSDPGNLGTLLRAAQALGVAWVIALPGTVDPFNPKAARASAGSLFRLPISQEPWPDVVAWLRERDFAIFGADPGGEPVGRSEAPFSRFALVLGNEPAGLSNEVLQGCDRRLAVPLPGGMDSLNVAIAGALLLDRLIAGPPAA